MGALPGCMSTEPTAPVSPFTMTMTAPSRFIVNDIPVDSSGLVKLLERKHVPKGEPLVIEMTVAMPFEAIKVITQQLTVAGYKPFFKSPRFSDSSVKKPTQLRNPPRSQRP
jgi:biopolymer transport protein ExbD